jgi:hypothetical protein
MKTRTPSSSGTWDEAIRDKVWFPSLAFALYLCCVVTPADDRSLHHSYLVVLLSQERRAARAEKTDPNIWGFLQQTCVMSRDDNINASSATDIKLKKTALCAFSDDPLLFSFLIFLVACIDCLTLCIHHPFRQLCAWRSVALSCCAPPTPQLW